MVPLRSVSEGWKAEITLKSCSGSKLVYQPSYYEIQIKITICQTDSIMTFIIELFQSEFLVLTGRFIKNMFPLHLCRPNDYTKEIGVLLQIQFYNISTNVLSIHFKSCH